MMKRSQKYSQSAQGIVQQRLKKRAITINPNYYLSTTNPKNAIL